ncbi:Uncharacterized protein Fot_19427 [Forsythia ovata]|uniref:Uncharacterized protein n=1 Tax=Forsythia ovata TaxID=205694 RepID=A0ABD1VL03_9LAMI
MFPSSSMISTIYLEAFLLPILSQAVPLDSHRLVALRHDLDKKDSMTTKTGSPTKSREVMRVTGRRVMITYHVVPALARPGHVHMEAKIDERFNRTKEKEIRVGVDF